MASRMWPVVAALGAAQTIAWASTYYLPAALGSAIAADTGLSTFAFFAIVTAALVISALLGPAVGRIVDRRGGRLVLAASTIPNALGLIALSQADSAIEVCAAWLALAIGMGLGLYEVSAAMLAHVFKAEARRAIAYYTLAAGLSSSFGWLVTSWSIDSVGWRGLCLDWALLHIGVALPLYLLLPESSDTQPLPAGGSTAPTAGPFGSSGRHPDNGLMLMMSLAFCSGALVIAGLAAHLPHILELAGADRRQALVAAALAGPAQIVMRGVEAVFLTRSSPLLIVGAASLLHPIGAALLLAAPSLSLFVFPVSHGMTSGVSLTARATLPLVLFGTQGFGARFGRLSRSIRIVTAMGPIAFAALIDQLGLLFLLVTSGLCVASAATFAVLRVRTRDGQAGESG